MAYIGKEPAIGNFVKLDAISTSSTNTYNLTLDSVAFTPESANHMLVSLNGVIQAPQTSFSVSGSTITFLPSSGTLSSSDSIDFIMVYGNVLSIGTPSDSTVTNAKTNFVTTSSAAGLQIKGDSTTAGALQLNCEQNSHGIKLQSPPHSANQSYTLKFPSGNVTAGKFLKVDSVSGSGTTGIGTMTFADAGGGQMELVTRTAITSNVSSVQFTNLEANNYHKFIFQGIDSTNNGSEDWCLQWSDDNGSSYTGGSAYKYSYWQHYSSGSTNQQASNGDSKICMADGFQNSGTDEGLHGECTISNIGNGQRGFAWGQTSHKADSTNTLRSTTFGGMITSGLTINAIQFFFSTGNISGSSYAFITHYKGIIA